jgi:hypothetical protein
MPIYTVRAPDGKSYDLRAPDGTSEEQLAQALYEQVPEAFRAPKQSSVLGELGRNIEQTVSSYRAGISGLMGNDRAGAEGGERGTAINARYGEAPSLDRLKQVYERDGLLSAAGTAITDIPRGIAAIAPSVATSLAGAAAGAKLGALTSPVTGPVGPVVGGALGMFASSYLPNLGNNLQRAREETGAEDLGKAATAAAGQSALDTASGAFVLGGKLLSKVLGMPVGKLGSDVAESTFKAILKGGARSTVELPTEIAQKALERMQAGLSLTDESAQKEYAGTAYSTAIGALPLGGYAGHRTNVMRRKEQVEREQEARRATDRGRPATRSDQPSAAS